MDAIKAMTEQIEEASFPYVSKRLHIGCGPIYLDGWTNIDISEGHRTDICGNVLEMNFEEVDVIYLCHVFEHFLFPDEAVKALSLFHKWLKPGCILRLAVPDLELGVFGYYIKKDLNFIYGDDFKAYYHRDTLCERLNFFIKAWDHKMCYDYELLSLLLADAGFKVIQKKQANESRIPNFTHDRFISESLYVEAIK